MRLDHATWYDALRTPRDAEQLLATPRWLSAAEAGRFVVNSGIAHRIVWGVAQDAASKGWTLSDGDAEVVERPFSDLITEAMGAARALGGAWVWPVIRGEDVDSWANPLPEGPHDVAAVQVLCRDEVTPLTWVTSAESEEWGRPEVVMVSPIRDGMSWPGKRIHTSRLAYIPGMHAWPSQHVRHQGYDLSALDLYRAAIESIEAAWNSTSLMLDRRALMWISLAGLEDGTTVETDAIAGDLRARMDAIVSAMKGRDPVLWLGEEDSTGWSAPPLSGTSEAVAALTSRLCAVEGIPASRLMGTPPGGLSTDDEAGRRSYTALIDRTRAAAEPAILKVYAIARGPDKARAIEWSALDDLTAREAADISLVHANRDAVLIQSGVIDASESRARLDDPSNERSVPVIDDELLGEPEIAVPPVVAPVTPDGQ